MVIVFSTFRSTRFCLLSRELFYGRRDKKLFAHFWQRPLVVGPTFRDLFPRGGTFFGISIDLTRPDRPLSLSPHLARASMHNRLPASRVPGLLNDRLFRCHARFIFRIVP
ncbi:MAG: hypothetical protein RBG13Loki_4161 [Promethearchaeota archaeon CR_4]|nr:MAG: hypothetical protein RBG13Loki_4161 [Candidatus Lokiarchaeota archaeon CR_4]